MKKRLSERSSRPAKIVTVERQREFASAVSRDRLVTAAIGGKNTPGADAWQRPRVMELMMSEYQDKRTQSQPRTNPREQLERLYREIGIPAVAAAAAQMSRPAKKTEKLQHELPFCLRDDNIAA